jgi:hypothetical protein
MKKVTLLLPNKIYRTLGTSRSSKTDLVEFIPENFMKVLCEDSSYHDRYKFKPEDVKILKIKSVTTTAAFTSDNPADLFSASAITYSPAPDICPARPGSP